MTEEQIRSNFNSVKEQIEETVLKAGRSPGSVKLCAVSKFHPVEDVYAALNSGQALFGENRVQEAYSKFTELRNSGKSFELHIIGSLQLNKVKKSVEIASCIQSVDRDELLVEIEKHCAKINKTIDVFFEIHTGEDSKSGYTDKTSLFASLEKFEKGIYTHIKPIGLMTMAPFSKDENIVRNSFRTTRLLKEEINAKFPDLPISELSMGMSGDYKIAIQEGSTMVRIGTALFGERC
ncbi:MAG: YggS family pyridoxal phosphate-dependent enzyme [Treponema sp.]|nr:YggS family pyridoxal phosphate-dependent enzyme [Treponema sp.]